MEVNEEEGYSTWQCMPDNILLQILSYLPAKAVLHASATCRCWYRVSHDEFLWRGLFYRNWQIPRNIPMAPGKSSWLQEYKRLYYHCPLLESEVIRQHTDQVLHVSFAHNGKMFATSSKDGYIRVWNATYPVSLKYKEDMKMLTWKYTQFSQFNETDTLLLVSGVHFGANSTSGEIAVFTLQEEFELQARVINKPYDVFGTWYNNSYLISGNLHWTGQLQSCSALWLNKASQETESEHESVVMRLYRFHNVNVSSIRNIMIANCPAEVDSQPEEEMAISVKPEGSDGTTMVLDDVAVQESSDGSYQDPSSTNSVVNSCKGIKGGKNEANPMQSDDAEVGEKLNGRIEYGEDYRTAETEIQSLANTLQLEVAMDTADARGSATASVSSNSNSLWNSLSNNFNSESSEGNATEGVSCQRCIEESCVCNNSKETQCSQKGCGKRKKTLSENSAHSKETSDINDQLATSSRKESERVESSHLNRAVFGSPLQSNFFQSSDHRNTLQEWDPFSVVHRGDMSIRYGVASKKKTAKHSSDKSSNNTYKTSNSKAADKYLIFTMGSKTYTPHQIGIKRIKSLENVHGYVSHLRLMPNVDEQHSPEGDRDSYDTVDKIIEMHGHIIGMCLSPDHRYLYVNSRQWPKNYKIENALYPPPIAQEIDIHVIDLTSMREVGTMHRSHKAYTPNDECFFIFLDVCQEYVASGAEDKHGYVWDRHYGVCLNKFPHNDVVNCVAFNPVDTETMVTVSDDNTIKIWRSRHWHRETKKQVSNSSCLQA